MSGQLVAHIRRDGHDVHVVQEEEGSFAIVVDAVTEKRRSKTLAAALRRIARAIDQTEPRSIKTRRAAQLAAYVAPTEPTVAIVPARSDASRSPERQPMNEAKQAATKVTRQKASDVLRRAAEEKRTEARGLLRHYLDTAGLDEHVVDYREVDNIVDRIVEAAVSESRAELADVVERFEDQIKDLRAKVEQFDRVVVGRLNP